MPVHYGFMDDSEPAWITITLAGPPVEVTWEADLEELAGVIDDVHDGDRQAVRRFLARLAGGAGQARSDSRKVTVRPDGQDGSITVTLTPDELLARIST